MKQLLYPLGNIAAAFGILLCSGSGLARLFGLYYIAGYESTTLFFVGTGLMVFACLAKLEQLVIQHSNM